MQEKLARSEQFESEDAPTKRKLLNVMPKGQEERGYADKTMRASEGKAIMLTDAILARLLLVAANLTLSIAMSV